jgi:hypothetical protein
MKSGVRSCFACALFAGLAPALGWAAPVDPAPELALCQTRPAHLTALSRISTRVRAAPQGERLAVRLSPENSVSLAGTSPDLDKARAQANGKTYAGLVRLVVTQPGTYRVGVDRDAWVDVATVAGKLLDPAPDEGTFTCDRAQKILVYALPAADTYWLQIALSPRRETMLTLIRAD